MSYYLTPLFYSHCNHEGGNVIVILSTMGTCQGDFLVEVLFTLVHFKVLCFTTSHFSFCLFPSIADDIHIISSLFIITSTYEHFQTKFCAIDLSIQPHKCVTWLPFVLSPDFNTPSKYITPSKGITFLGIPLKISSFTSSFIKNALLEDVQHDNLFPRMGDVHVTFGIIIHYFM